MTKFYKAVAIILGVLLIFFAVYLRTQVNSAMWQGTMIAIAPGAILGIFALWGLAWIMHRIDDIETRISILPDARHIQTLEQLLRKKS